MSRLSKHLTSLVLSGLIVFFIISYIVPYFENQKYNFTLQGSSGQVSLSDFKNKNVIIFFGYLSCPDVCPTTLSTISNAFKKLSIQEKNNFAVIFVSIDPDRDKPDEIDSYVQYFIPSGIGLTGDKDTLDSLREAYRVYYVKDKSTSAMGYTISHTTAIYFFKTRNRFHKRLSQHDDEAQIYNTMKEIL